MQDLVTPALRISGVHYFKIEQKELHNIRTIHCGIARWNCSVIKSMKQLQAYKNANRDQLSDSCMKCITLICVHRTFCILVFVSA